MDLARNRKDAAQKFDRRDSASRPAETWDYCVWRAAAGECCPNAGPTCDSVSAAGHLPNAGATRDPVPAADADGNSRQCSLSKVP